MANIQIAGRLARDADKRYAKNGKTVITFSIAENIYINKEQKAQFFNCEMWGERAEKLAQYLQKGTAATVFGSLRISQYQAKNGEIKQGLDVNVNDIILQSSNYQQPSAQPNIDPHQPMPIADSDIPF